MNESEWRSQIQQFKDLLRVPVGDEEAGARRDRKGDIEFLHGVLPYLVFESYQDWYDQEDDWLIRNLSQWLTDEQDGQLLSLLRAGDDGMLLTYLADTCVPDWRQAAQEGGRFRQGAPDEEADPEGGPEFVGAENSVNWNASRTPGTFYYIFDRSEYFYGDEQRAAASAWRTLPERERAAAQAAQPWGAGWYTPTYGAPQYGDDYVFATDPGGPWLSMAEATRQLDELEKAAAPPAEVVAPQPMEWGPVWTSLEDGGWMFGLTEQGPWTYSDGAHALDEQQMADGVVERLLTRYPKADAAKVRERVLRQVAETSREYVHQRQ